MKKNRLTLRVSKEKHGMRLLAFLRDHAVDGLSVKGLKRLIEAKRCQINGRVETFSTHALFANDLITLDHNELPQMEKPVVLFEDADLIIYNKPSGLVCEEDSFRPFFLVHRLDKETSGVLLLAKSEAVREKLVSLFEARSVKKSYLALVDGYVAKKEGKIVSSLVKKGAYQGQTIWGSDKLQRGKEAITHWNLLKQERGLSLLRCEPLTGRTHQIRVHLSEMGHPVLGDYQYAKRFSINSVPRQLLHAQALEFTHPITQEPLLIQAAIPQDFHALFNC